MSGYTPTSATPRRLRALAKLLGTDVSDVAVEYLWLVTLPSRGRSVWLESAELHRVAGLARGCNPEREPDPAQLGRIVRELKAIAAEQAAPDHRHEEDTDDGF